MEGWWFYESTAEHFDDWVRYGLPHLVVLYDFELRVSFWVHVTAARCVITGKGCKILVPCSQKIDIDHLDALLTVASAQRAASLFEQKVYHASAAAAPPARRLRYALLTPRLIAPHANAGYEHSPEPEEYLALLVRRRSHQIAIYKQKFPQLLESEKLRGHADWRWRFAFAFNNWLELDDLQGLKELLLIAPTAMHRSAVIAVMATAYFENGDHADAECLVNEEISKDETGPADLAWLLAHRAGLKIERGDVVGARSDAANATKALRGDEDDPSAALLAGVAADILFKTAGFGSGDIEHVINSNDTAPAWWRAQTMSWALGHLDDASFDDWLEGDQIRFSVGNEGWENLESSRLNSGLCADHDAWRSISARQGRLLTRLSQPSGDSLRLLQGLDQLRRAGDREALTGAVGAVWQVGPVAVVREVAELASPSSMTRSTAFATIKLWGAAADALSEVHASELASWCIDILIDEKARDSFRTRLAPAFLVESAVLEALNSLMPIASSSEHERAAELVLAAPTKSIVSDDWMRLVLTLNEEAIRAVGLDRLHMKARQVEGTTFSDALLLRLALCGEASAQMELVGRASSDLFALELVAARLELSREIVGHLTAILQVQLSKVRQAAAKGSYGFGGVDAARLLARLNLLHPEGAQWDLLLAFLSDPAVAGEHKQGACIPLVECFSQLNADVKARVRAVIPSVASTAFVLPHARPRSPEEAWQLQIVSTESAEQQDVAVAVLLSGTPSHRRVAARLLATGVAPSLTPALHVLLVDESRGVRRAAAFAVGAVLGRASAPVDMWFPALARICSDTGASVPASFLNGISDAPFGGDPRILNALEPLKLHDSFGVRWRAAKFLDGERGGSDRCREILRS